MADYVPGDKNSFVEALMPYALEQSQRTGVDPRIIIAQAAQETGWGKHVPGGNLFGIKSHGKSGGNTFATNEVINGETVRLNDSFRSFGTVADSVAGYGDFILENPRYGDFRSAQGLEAQAEALQRSGYATDPNYGSSVYSIAQGIPMTGGSDYARGAASGRYNPDVDASLPTPGKGSGGGVSFSGAAAMPTAGGAPTAALAGMFGDQSASPLPGFNLGDMMTGPRKPKQAAQPDPREQQDFERKKALADMIRY